MENENHLCVVSGPSGVGKDSVVSKLRADHPEIAKTISATTRAPRSEERDGVDYFFCTEAGFQKLLDDGKLLEYNDYNGHRYGTLQSEVERCLGAGKLVVLVIDVHGAANIKRLYPGANTVFLLPPSREELKNRLRGRGSEGEDQIEGRLQESLHELACKDTFDRCLVNAEIDTCADQLYRLICELAGVQ